MTTITDSAVIGRTVEDVWRLISDPRNNPKWFEGTAEMRRVPEGTVTAGATTEAVVQFRGRPLTIKAKMRGVQSEQGNDMGVLFQPYQWFFGHVALGARRREIIEADACL